MVRTGGHCKRDKLQVYIDFPRFQPKPRIAFQRKSECITQRQLADALGMTEKRLLHGKKSCPNEWLGGLHSVNYVNVRLTIYASIYQGCVDR